MSYFVLDTSPTEYLRGILDTAVNIGDNPITIAAWFKTSTPNTENAIVCFSSDTASQDNSMCLYQGGSGISLTARCTSTTTAYSSATYTNPGYIGAGWFPGVAVFRSTTYRAIYAGPSATFGEYVNNPNDAGTGMDVISIGVGGAVGQKFTGFIAEPAIWHKELTDSERKAFCGGAIPSAIAPESLVGYWPLDRNLTIHPNLGTYSGGDLTVTNATYSSDHPEIVNIKKIFKSAPVKRFKPASSGIINSIWLAAGRGIE